MNNLKDSIIFCIILFFCILLAFYIARYLGKRRLIREGEVGQGSDLMVGAIFGLMGLLIAFSFSGAYTRYEDRRNLIVNESNAIGTAYLRIDLLPLENQAKLRSQFKEYAKNRAEFYNQLKEPVEAIHYLRRSEKLQKEIWLNVVSSSTGSDYSSARMLLIPSINEMIDIVSVRSVAIQNHPPKLIFYTLAFFAILCSWMSGDSTKTSKKPFIFYSITFAITIAGMLYVILDIEFPGEGIINLKNVNNVLIQLMKTME